MIAETIAIVALAGAGYAVFVARRTEAGVLELVESLAGDEEEDAEPETGELWLSEGEFYSPDKAALEAKFPSGLGFVQCEGVPSVVTDSGVWSMHKLLSEPAKPRAVR